MASLGLERGQLQKPVETLQACSRAFQKSEGRRGGIPSRGKATGPKAITRLRSCSLLLATGLPLEAAAELGWSSFMFSLMGSPGLPKEAEPLRDAAAGRAGTLSRGLPIGQQLAWVQQPSHLFHVTSLNSEKNKRRRVLQICAAFFHAGAHRTSGSRDLCCLLLLIF